LSRGFQLLSWGFTLPAWGEKSCGLPTNLDPEKSSVAWLVRGLFRSSDLRLLGRFFFDERRRLSLETLQGLVYPAARQTLIMEKFPGLVPNVEGSFHSVSPGGGLVLMVNQSFEKGWWAFSQQKKPPRP
jgi:hypothetical protein